MGKTWVLYKGVKFELNEYKLQTLTIEGVETKMIYCRYKQHEFEAETLPLLRGKLEKIFDDELKKVEGIKFGN